MATPGKNYLFFSGDGFAWVGEYVGQISINLHNVVKACCLCETAGTSWFHLAKDPSTRNQREIIRMVEGTLTIPTPVFIEWKGDLYTRDLN